MPDELPQVVETSRLVLRPLSDEHAETIARLMTPGVSRWLGSWPSSVSVDDVRQRMANARAAQKAGTEIDWLVHRREDDAPVGWIRVARESALQDRGELGYWIDEAFHGHGYATEAARAALAAVFQGWKLSVVESGAQLANDASFAVMRKLGMTPIGDRLVWASTRGRDELCRFFAITRAALDGAIKPRR